MKKLSRRTLFGLAGAIPTIAIVFAKQEVEERTPRSLFENRGQFYRKYEMLWTGWKVCQNTDLLVGQWIGYPVNAKYQYQRSLDHFPYLVSSVPGACAAYRRGDCFNIDIYPDQAPVNYRTLEADKEIYQRAGKKRLMLMIDLVRDKGWVDVEVESWNREFFLRGIIPNPSLIG